MKVLERLLEREVPLHCHALIRFGRVAFPDLGFCEFWGVLFVRFFRGSLGLVGVRCVLLGKYRRRGSNPHSHYENWILNPARLPFRHSGSMRLSYLTSLNLATL